MMTRASIGAMEGAAVDEVVRRLVEGGRSGRQVQLSEAEIRQLCVEAKRVLLSEPNLLRIHAPVKICGERSLCFPAPALPISGRSSLSARPFAFLGAPNRGRLLWVGFDSFGCGLEANLASRIR
jgi:hypothetical protein